MATILKTNSLLDSPMNLNGIVYCFNTPPSVNLILQVFLNNVLVDIYNSSIAGVSPIEERTNEKGDVIKRYILMRGSGSSTIYQLSDTNVTKIVFIYAGVDNDGGGAISGVTIPTGATSRENGIFYDKQFVFLKEKIKNNNISLRSNYSFQNNFDIAVFNGYTSIRRIQFAFCSGVYGDISNLADGIQTCTVLNFQGTRVEGVLDYLIDIKKEVATANSSISCYFAGTKVTFNGEPADNVKFTFDGQGGYTVEDL